MTPKYPTPTVMLWPEQTAVGTEYRPGNVLAVTLAKLIGKDCISERHLPLIEELGFRISFPDGRPIPYKPSSKIRYPQPQRILDSV